MSRSWAGLNTHRATTTAIIREIDGIDLDDYTEAVSSSLEQQGGDTSEAGNIAERLAALAAGHPVGSVFGHRLSVLYVRETPRT